MEEKKVLKQYTRDFYEDQMPDVILINRFLNKRYPENKLSNASRLREILQRGIDSYKKEIGVSEVQR